MKGLPKQKESLQFEDGVKWRSWKRLGLTKYEEFLLAKSDFWSINYNKCEEWAIKRVDRSKDSKLIKLTKKNDSNGGQSEAYDVRLSYEKNLRLKPKS